MIKVNAISIGKIETLSYGNYKPMQSALNKIPFKGQMWLNRLGFVDDEQAYHKHGGIHKAICCFSKSNYQLFKDDLHQ
ncbi:MAG: MOSC domain-containing protein, partial [Staphylococcus epidermidis]|nr:MOSC domain-containing protein [Staphylococcus epidermidis]